jgi:hypothetical protein
VKCGDTGAVAITSTLRNGKIQTGSQFSARLKLREGDLFS